MSNSLFIRNVQIASEDSTELVRADVLVADGVYQNIGSDLEVPEGAKVIEGGGRLLMPSMFDAHVHFREPGGEAKEDIAS
ncbi:MAG: dihydroorotase, partial [Haloferula sp.]